MLTPFCRKFREFLFAHFGQFSRIFRHIGENFPGIVPASKFCLLGSPENGGGTGPGFDSRRGAPIQHILFDTNNNKDNNNIQNHMDNKEDAKTKDVVKKYVAKPWACLPYRMIRRSKCLMLQLQLLDGKMQW